MAFYRESEAAKELGLSPNTLRIWRKRGKGPPYYKVGKKVIYTSGDLAKWLNDRRVDPEKEPAM
jgi:DNA-binding transcriptional MerR regulator